MNDNELNRMRVREKEQEILKTSNDIINNRDQLRKTQNEKKILEG